MARTRDSLLSQLGEAHDQLKTANDTIAVLRDQENKDRDTITQLREKLNIFSRCTFIATQLSRVYAPLHHLGAYEVIERTRDEWKVSGTLSGFFGLHPTDVSPGLEPRKIRFDQGFTTGVVTWDWREAIDVGHPLYSRITEPPGFTHHFVYPDSSLSGFIVRSFDHNPPDPGFHDTGLMAEVTRWRTSIWNGDYETQNRNLNDALNRWCDRVNPFVVRLEYLVNILISAGDAINVESPVLGCEE